MSKKCITIILSKNSNVKPLHVFFINNTFISNARLKLAKNQANAKQNPEAELLLFKLLAFQAKTWTQMY